jgi:uncharacterized cupin superfamily protein
MSTPVLKSVASVSLGEYAAKPTAVTPGQVEASLALWEGMPGVESGVWEASPGTFTATRDGYHEVCVVVSGRVTVTEDGGEPIELAAGDLFVTPAGWSGVWEVHERLRKVYVTIDV